MHDPDKPITSVSQDDWLSLYTAARREFALLIPLMPAMKPEEVKLLIESMNAAMWGNHQAETFDKRTELELQRITPE